MLTRRLVSLIVSLSLGGTSVSCKGNSNTSSATTAAAPTTPKEAAAPAEPAAPVQAAPDVGEDAAKIPLFVRRADYAITKLNLKEAESLLEGQVGADAARARARLAIYRADCQGAMAHLASRAAKEARGAEMLLDLATRCHGATAGGTVIFDEARGVWLRLQDASDKVLVPLLLDVAVRARETLEKDLGVDLPRPLRIDLVRDLFSLSAVSGLPLESAETTGTVAVARWGRVTMVSPRAMTNGFPWADTLAHEVTHLLLSRATADRAPLWLQEGVAKREEHRWRGKEPFDHLNDFGKTAYEAEMAGKSVGVTSIGPSIAMLPSAEAAGIAFAEVTSFMDFWIKQNGPYALSLLLREMEIATDEDQATRGVSGYSLDEWQRLYRLDLARRYQEAGLSEPPPEVERLGPRALGRELRLTELLTNDGHAAEAVERLAPQMDRGMHSAAFRYYAARADLLQGRGAEELLGEVGDLQDPEAGFLALSATQMAQGSTSPLAHSYRSAALGLDPLLPEVACGEPWVGNTPTKAQQPAESLPGSQAWERDLCAHVRSLPVRGTR